MNQRRAQGLIVFTNDWTPVMLPLRHYGPFSSCETAMEMGSARQSDLATPAA